MYMYVYVQQLIVINRIQNKSVYCVYLLCIYKDTVYILKIFTFIHVYIYIHIIYIIYKYI